MDGYYLVASCICVRFLCECYSKEKKTAQQNNEKMKAIEHDVLKIYVHMMSSCNRCKTWFIKRPPFLGDHEG